MTSGKFATTLGYERRFNPAFQFERRDAFIRFMTTGQPSRPANVENIVAINQGRRPLTMALSELPALPPDAFESRARAGALIVDARDSALFGAGHIPGAYNVQLSSPEFEQRLGWVLPGETELLLVLQRGSEAARAQLAAAFIGLDRRLGGYLEGGMGAWQQAGKPVEALPQIRPEDLNGQILNGVSAVLDVRGRDEWNEGHIDGALHMHYRDLVGNLEQLPLRPDQRVAVICASGYRSSIAASVLLRHGFTNLVNVSGGMDAWRAAGLPRIDGGGQTC